MNKQLADQTGLEHISSQQVNSIFVLPACTTQSNKTVSCKRCVQSPTRELLPHRAQTARIADALMSI